ncbi:tripartite tricarboxylate transporter TctB family protein [Nitratireductor luteus]|uniref:tripartite tricarboxylate transporter TctB family protein n=1 Tax=Nitratireductor luteus TaxID=2976980 RepID=UPI00223F6CB3|nr:tripartite tricarboxylate transporter TctB family protein [Nitratireductor luteus]
MSGPKTLRPGERVFACLIVLFSAVALWQAFLISGFTGLSQPGVFPMLAAAAMLGSALFILRDTLRARVDHENRRTFAAGMAEVVPVKLLVMLVLVAAYLAAMPLIGFVLASGVFLFVSFAFLWRRHVLVCLALSLVSLAIVYFLFRVIFQVVLPQGQLIPPGVF